ncbi:MAG: phenylalanine--tRNA ligase subunit beta, partial [Dehalococcoidia bacterium]|nr:phenylalanine--tRNA ligase subunit beta [Dehalococcoidia bacterium]
MRIPLSWLKEYVDTSMTPGELAHRLTMAGLETEVSADHDWDGVRVGVVTRVDAHPNADRLRLATVETGEGERTVVCGAPNVAPGQKVAYAGIGAHLIDAHNGEPLVLKPAKIRGVESAGMVCSERELGLSDEHEGILVLPGDAPVGAPLSSYLDTVALETTPTPNRPDWFSVIGTALEVAAIEGKRVSWPDDSYEASGEEASALAGVSIEDPDLCARYIATVVRGITVGPSPKWFQERLGAAGMRPINNVVDVTNYVMLELGQPLHAFDYDRLHGHQIVARRARPGEAIVTLDGVRRDLEPNTLVIADADRPLVIAGIFGGEDAEVGAGTVNVLIEAASFDQVSVRRSAARYGLKTEAAIRFERGLSAAMPLSGARRATQLLVEVCGGTAAHGVIDVYPGEKPATSLRVERSRLSAILGVEISPQQTTQILESLGFEVSGDANEVSLAPPHWRVDVSIAEDIAEELARIIGYDELPTRPLSGSLPEYRPNESRDFRERLRLGLAAAGLQEVITYSLTTLEELQRVLPAGELEAHPPLRVLNPLSSQHELARTTLRASLLRTLSHNLRQVDGPVSIFEIAKTYLPRPDDLPEEREVAVGVVAGRTLDRWGREAEPIDFYSAKGMLEHTFAGLHVEAVWSQGRDHALVPGRTAEILGAKSSERVGVLGQVTPEVATSFDINGDVFLFELDVESVRRAAPLLTFARPVVRYPAVKRDLALLVDQGVESGAIQAIIEQNKLVVSAAPFDLYQ